MDELESYLGAIFITKKYRGAITLGCSYGELTKFLNQFCHTEGIDIAERFIKKARKYFPDVKFTVADATKYKPKKKFDVAVTHGLLIHVSSKDIKRAIKNIMRIANEAIFVESSVNPTYEKKKLKYNARRYWNHRAKYPDEKDDLPMPYYFNHDYPEIFKELKVKFEIIKTFDIGTQTRMYLCTK